MPFIADRCYDAIDIIHNLLEKGFKPAIKTKRNYEDECQAFS